MVEITEMIFPFWNNEAIILYYIKIGVQGTEKNNGGDDVVTEFCISLLF